MAVRIPGSSGGDAGIRAFSLIKHRHISWRHDSSSASLINANVLCLVLITKRIPMKCNTKCIQYDQHDRSLLYSEFLRFLAKTTLDTLNPDKQFNRQRPQASGTSPFIPLRSPLIPKNWNLCQVSDVHRNQIDQKLTNLQRS